LPRNRVLLYRLDHWNWRLPPRRVEENWTRAVVRLGDRGRRAGKKGKHRKGRECRVPFHENQSVLLTFLGSAELPDHVLADFIGLVGVRGRTTAIITAIIKVLISMVFNIKMRTDVNIQIMANPPS
jgi:hypothetical protein